MIILDSDHLSILQHPESPQFERLIGAMEQSTDSQFATTVISLEEQTRGWLAAINRAKNAHEQIPYYSRLKRLIDFYGHWLVAPFDEPAADWFTALRKQRIRIGTMDLKIAAIVKSNNALLLSANARDFSQVPGLRVENWL